MSKLDEMSKYAKDKEKGKNNTAETVEAEADRSALEYLQDAMDKKDLEKKIDETVKEFAGLISKEGAMHVIAREMGWSPPTTKRIAQKELPMMSGKYLEEKASVVTEREEEKEDGTKTTVTYYGTWGSFIAAVANISELLTSSQGDNYIIVDLVGEDIQGVPLFLWREKAVNERYIRPQVGKLMAFRSVLIKHNQSGGYRLSAAKFFGVETYEKEGG